MAYTHLSHLHAAHKHIRAIIDERQDDDADLGTALRALNRAIPRYSQDVCYSNPCEWNPTKNRTAYDYEVHAQADVIVGAEGAYRLCNDCAALPRFSRYRRRTVIVRKREPAA